jgi:hypothetical protein
MKKNRDIAKNAKTIKIHTDDIYPIFSEKIKIGREDSKNKF